MIETSKPGGGGGGGGAAASSQYSTIAELEALLADGDDIEATLPSYHALQTAVSHAKDWLAKVPRRNTIGLC